MREKNRSDIRRFLPWIVIVVALLLYLLTVEHWLTLSSLLPVSYVTGWQWRPQTTEPLYYLSSLPARIFPASVQPIVLNICSAIFSALTLGLLARSVMLLPHDRTRAQRQREASQNFLLSIPFSWIPPVFAALILGLQLSFWEHAVASTGEALNLLVFAYVIRCMLEFRVSARESWLMKMAFVYGIGVTNNWAMIGFFPAALTALIWIKGIEFFRWRFITRMVLCGLAGLLFYLVLPIVGTFGGQEGANFFEYLRSNLGAQKFSTINSPFLTSYRLNLFTLFLTSLLPLLVMGIRWPSFRGDVSASGQRLTDLMFRLVHLVFLTACVAVFFDWKFSGRVLGFGVVPFLTFYYLSALAVGYFSGYVLLVFGREPEREWQRSRRNIRKWNRAIAFVIPLALVAVPSALCYRNFKFIHVGGKPLTELADAMAEKIPSQGAVIISDDPTLMTVLNAAYVRAGKIPGNLLLESKAVEFGVYHLHLWNRFPQFQKVVPDIRSLPATLPPIYLIQWLDSLGKQHPIFYLQPSFGYYMERFYLEPDGIVYRMKAYPDNTSPKTPGISDAETTSNDEFWNRRTRGLRSLPALGQQNMNALLACNTYSRALNYWGVELQKLNRLTNASAFFEDAKFLNKDNIAALINSEFNQHLQKGETSGVQTAGEIDKKMKQFRSWNQVLLANGPIDDPEIRYAVGQSFSAGGNARQAALEFNRILELNPHHVAAQLALANTYLTVGFAEEVLRVISNVRSNSSDYPLQPEQELGLMRLEAQAYATKGENQLAEEILLDAQTRHPENNDIATLLVQFYMENRRYENALEVTKKQLSLDPKDQNFLLTQGALYLFLGRPTDAIATMDQLLALNPEHSNALINRSLAYMKLERYEEARRDCEKLKISIPTSPLVYSRLGEIAYKTNDKTEAIKNYRKYTELAQPGTDEYNQIATRLKELENAK